MNGPHDLGGRMGFGPVEPEADEPVFHAEWEKRALGLTLCAARPGGWTLDESRHMRESLHPADYHSSSYYAIWIKGLERLLVRHGLVSPDELAAGHATDGPPPGGKVLKAEDVAGVLSRGGSTERDIGEAPRFAAGDLVRARNLHPKGHTRLPGYVKGHVGRIEALNGAHVFPDTNAHGGGEQPQHFYTVAFEARELWGAVAEAGHRVLVDAWESYLEPA